MWERDNYGNAIKLAFQMKFKGGIETICGNAIYGDDDEIPMRKRANCGNAIHSTNMAKFQGGIETNMEMR